MFAIFPRIHLFTYIYASIWINVYLYNWIGFFNFSLYFRAIFMGFILHIDYYF